MNDARRILRVRIFSSQLFCTLCWLCTHTLVRHLLLNSFSQSFYFLLGEHMSLLEWYRRISECIKTKDSLNVTHSWWCISISPLNQSRSSLISCSCFRHQYLGIYIVHYTLEVVLSPNWCWTTEQYIIVWFSSQYCRCSIKSYPKYLKYSWSEHKSTISFCLLISCSELS